MVQIQFKKKGPYLEVPAWVHLANILDGQLFLRHLCLVLQTLMVLGSQREDVLHRLLVVVRVLLVVLWREDFFF